MNQKTNWKQFGTLITVFFFWGFVAASNDILIPVFKHAFKLSQVESQWVTLAFYLPYTIGAIIYFLVSKSMGGDLLNKIGYKNGIAYGLVISTLGALIFYPAANNASYPLMLTALFVVGLGFSLQQIAANPLAIVIGDPRSGSQRLSMAGGINNFGTTIGPLIVSFAIFGSVSGGSENASIDSVKIPYLILGGAFLLVAILFKFSSVTNKIDLETVANEDAEAESSQIDLDKANITQKVADRPSVFSYPQLIMGMIAIFVYVGVEVATASNLPAYLEKDLGILTKDVAPYVSLYWASLMMGRWTASVGAFDLNAGVKKMLSFFMPYLAFAVYIIVNKIAGHDITPMYYYAIVIVALIIGNILSGNSPARMLLIYSFMGIIALCIGMLTSGMTSVFAFVSVGLFCSTLWPCIFTLGIAGLGKHTNEGSSLLVMMILGGALLPILQGKLADGALGIKYSYILGAICFVYLAFYAIRAKGILKAQGIDYDKKIGGGH